MPIHPGPIALMENKPAYSAAMKTEKTRGCNLAFRQWRQMPLAQSRPSKLTSSAQVCAKRPTSGLVAMSQRDHHPMAAFLILSRDLIRKARPWRTLQWQRQPLSFLFSSSITGFIYWTHQRSRTARRSLFLTSDSLFIKKLYTFSFCLINF